MHARAHTYYVVSGFYRSRACVCIHMYVVCVRACMRIILHVHRADAVGCAQFRLRSHVRVLRSSAHRYGIVDAFILSSYIELMRTRRYSMGVYRETRGVFHGGIANCTMVILPVKRPNTKKRTTIRVRRYASMRTYRYIRTQRGRVAYRYTESFGFNVTSYNL